MRAAVLLVVSTALPLAAACRGAEPAKAAAPVSQPSVQGQASTVTPNADVFTGTVAETMNSGGYTYARLQAPGKDDVWLAASEFSTKAGDRLTVPLEGRMENFKSKTLGRTFPVIYFVSTVTREGQASGAPGNAGAVPALMSSHARPPEPTRVEPVAPPPGGMSIADVWEKRSSLAGQQVTVRGTVVKVNEQIMGLNWVHLQDGSGSADARTNDLTITSGEVAKVGSVITVTGVLAVDKDFGAGYTYRAILENATLVK